MRIGQFNHGDEDGFGKRHIEQDHTVVPPAFDIQDTIRNPEFCSLDLDTRIRCFNENTLLFVVYSPIIDPRSGDFRPFGIITAYYQLPCLAAQPAADPPYLAGTSRSRR